MVLCQRVWLQAPGRSLQRFVLLFALKDAPEVCGKKLDGLLLSTESYLESMAPSAREVFEDAVCLFYLAVCG
jgi:hypothetical protein